MKRNEWFQRMVVKRLQDGETTGPRDRSPVVHGPWSGGPFTLFAYSYAARDILRYAKDRGWRTVLGQIDPGLHEEKLVQRLFEESAGVLGDWQPAPAEYWRSWRTECDLADLIVVNSEWSRQGLMAEGISADKLRVVPLAYETEGQQDHRTEGFERCYPERFTSARPMRVLFLGQINLRKGARPLLEAVRLLADEPIEFRFVGPAQISGPEGLREHPRVRWFGAVSRQDTARFYREADVFIFPTLSDGFGLTQLEAQSWKLPVIASRFCGDVVEDGRNGVLLPEVSAEAIVEVLRELLRNPGMLQQMADASGVPSKFSFASLATALRGLFDAAPGGPHAPRPCSPQRWQDPASVH
jgi:glycosyltransferase involved in cell wall biosynthesis